MSLSLYAQQYYANPNGVEDLNNSRIGKALSGNRNWVEQVLKSRQELDEYFKCHISSGMEGSQKIKAQNRLQEFNVKYKPILELATQHYQIPYALATCVLFRETLFSNINNTSSGARGMGQIMPQTYQEVLEDLWRMVPKNERQINGQTRKIEAYPWEDAYQEYLQKVRDFEPSNPKNRCKENPEFACDGGLDYITKYTGKNLYIRAVSFGHGLESKLYSSASSEEREKSLKVTKEQRNQFRINRSMYQQHKTFIWDYYRHIKSQDPVKAAIMFPNTGAGWPKGPDLMPPSNIDTMTQNPLWVVATNMYVLKQMMLQADAKLGDCQLRDNDMIGFLMFLGGGYNGGSSRLVSTVKRGCSNIKRWCEEAKGYTSETKNYMLSIRRCMTRGSSTSPTGQHKGSCQGDGLPETSDPCDPITPLKTNRTNPWDKTYDNIESSY